MPIPNSETSKFKAFSDHIFKWEGSMGDDPKDNASKCVKGLTNVAKRGKAGLPIHTVKGVTYCTFKENAAKLGIFPVTHQRFVSMTKDDVRKFQYFFYTMDVWSNLNDGAALSMTETSWMAGPTRPWQIAIDSLKALGVPTVPKKASGGYTKAEKLKIVSDIKKVPENKFFDAFNEAKKQWFLKLGSSPGYTQYNRGWQNRINDFIGQKATWVAKSFFPFFF